MNNLTLVIPAKYEVSTLPIVLRELEKYNVRKTIVIPEYDKQTQEVVKGFDCNIVKQKGEGFGSALIEGIETVETKYLCIFKKILFLYKFIKFYFVNKVIIFSINFVYSRFSCCM